MRVARGLEQTLVNELNETRQQLLIFEESLAHHGGRNVAFEDDSEDDELFNIDETDRVACVEIEMHPHPLEIRQQQERDSRKQPDVPDCPAEPQNGAKQQTTSAHAHQPAMQVEQEVDAVIQQEPVAGPSQPSPVNPAKKKKNKEQGVKRKNAEQQTVEEAVAMLTNMPLTSTPRKSTQKSAKM